MRVWVCDCVCLYNRLISFEMKQKFIMFWKYYRNTYRITEIFIDVELSLATSNSFIVSAKELECVAKIAAGFSFTCLVTSYPLYSKQTNISPRLKFIC